MRPPENRIAEGISRSHGTIVIPAFNRPRRLRRAVDSVLEQTWFDFELVVVDDASTEDMSGVRDCVEQAGRRWLRFEEKRGPAAARNAGVAAATDGEWIAFLDSDDTWLPEKLDRQLLWHREHPNIAISQCEEVWVRDGVRMKKPARLRQPESGRVFELCANRCCLSASCVLMSRELWNRFGGFDERFWVCEDYELWLRISLENEIGFVPGNLVEKQGGHPDQMSVSFRAIDRWRVWALMKLAGTGLPAGRHAVVIAAIAEKAGILVKGARKRELAEVDFYREIEDWAKEAKGRGPEDGVPANLLAGLEDSVLGQFGFRGSAE